MKWPYIAIALLGVYSAVASVSWFGRSPPETPPDQTAEVEALKGELAKRTAEVADLNGRIDLLEKQLALAAAPAPEEPRDEFDDLLDDELGLDEPIKVKTQTPNSFAGFMSNLVSLVTNSLDLSQTNGGLFGGSEMGKAWRDQMKLGNRQRIAREYADLLSMFDLDFDQRQAFIELLAERGGGGNRWMNRSGMTNSPW
ncbi:MAG: hypothetical protein AAF492_30400, partial [Verrucomicrobiota bacterium]